MDSLISLITSLLAPPLNFVIQTFSYIKGCEDNIGSLTREVGELKSQRDDLRAKVVAAKNGGQQPTYQVEWWLERVQEIEDEATAIEEEFRSSKYVGLNFQSNYHLSKRAHEKRQEAIELKSKGVFSDVANKTFPVRFVEMPSAQLVGADAVLAQLQRLVEDPDVSVIGVHGMGGVGKTAILKKFHNEYLRTAWDFEAVIWIEASKDFNLERVQRAIGDRLGLPWEEWRTPTERGTILFNLLRKMRFVLLIDDLWEHLDLEMLGVPILEGESSSTLILTTRMESVCDQMDVWHKIKVECLEWDDAWNLFQQKAGEKLINSGSEIQRCAKELARMCDGLPLALIRIGRSMAGKRTTSDWRHAVTTLNTTPWRLEGMDHVFGRLKLSYDNLHDSVLRTCLMFALTVPMEEKCGNSQDNIINLCISEGAIDGFHDIEEAYNKGHHLLGILKASSLLESGVVEDYFRLHPMMRATLCWIGCGCGAQEGRWLVRTKVGPAEIPDAEQWGGAELISFLNSEILALPEAPECPELSILSLHEDRGLPKIPDDFFRFMPSLRVLDLSWTLIKELPAGISALVGLQHLDLSLTSITSLPAELGSLANLRFLSLFGTLQLRTIPKGVIARLSGLRILNSMVSVLTWEAHAAEEGGRLEELECLRHLRAIGICVGTEQAIRKLSRSRQLLPCVQDLGVQRVVGLATVQLPSRTALPSMPSLRSLVVNLCDDLERVVIGDGRAGRGRLFFPNLEYLHLSSLPKARIVWKGKSLQNLRRLRISECCSIQQLLECEDEVTQSGGEGRDREPFVAFPNLVEMKLEDLPQFRSLSMGGRTLCFPSLEKLLVIKCPELKQLTVVAEQLLKIECSEEWWDQLEWEDEESDRSSFLPVFGQY